MGDNPIYSTLLLVMGGIFLLSWLAQSLAGHVVANEEAASHGVPAQPWLEYVGSPEYWNRTLQNWQPEFLAVGAMVTDVLDLPASARIERVQPVGTPHHTTSVEAE